MVEPSTADKAIYLGSNQKSRQQQQQMKTRSPKSTAAPVLEVPLSELGDTSVKNISEWVQRPAGIRQKETKQRHGRITRPMNSFMLYRSAYMARAQAWCLQNKQQVLSSVVGQSWLKERPEVRRRYQEYANIEKDNHRAAHPAYKFSPTRKARGGDVPACQRTEDGVPREHNGMEQPVDAAVTPNSPDDSCWAVPSSIAPDLVPFYCYSGYSYMCAGGAYQTISCDMRIPSSPALPRHKGWDFATGSSTHEELHEGMDYLMHGSILPYYTTPQKQGFDWAE